MSLVDKMKNAMNTSIFSKEKQDKLRANVRGFKLNLDDSVKIIKDTAGNYARREIDLGFFERLTRKIYTNPYYISFVIFIQFVMFLILIFYYNPMSVVDKYPIIMKLLTLMLAFTYVVLFFFIKDKVKRGEDVDLISPTENDTLKRILVIVVFFTLLMLSLKGFVWLCLNTPLANIFRHSVLTLCIIVMLSVLYLFMKKYIDKAKNAPGKPLYSLIIKFIMYLPCLLVDIVEYVKYEINLTTKPVWILAGVEAGLLVVWFALPYLLDKVTNMSGLKLLNAPIYLNKETTVGNYKQLHEKHNLLMDLKSGELSTMTDKYANTKADDNNSEENCNQLDASGNINAACANYIWKQHGCSTNISETQKAGRFMLTGTDITQSFDLTNKSLEDVKNYIAASAAKYPDSCAAKSDNVSDTQAPKDSYTDPNIPKNENLAWIYKKVKEFPYFKVKTSKHPQYTDTKLRRFRYTYAISGWFYLNPQPPNTRSAYNRYTNILNYGRRINVEYNGNLGSLRVMANIAQPDDVTTHKDDDDKNNMSVEVYETTDVLYQKWNNIVVNYDNGYLDVFLNGILVGSKSGVAPYMAFDNIVVGSDNGLQGGICNVIYYENVLKKREISLKYKSLREKAMPYIWSISDDLNTKMIKQEPNPKSIQKIKHFFGVQ